MQAHHQGSNPLVSLYKVAHLGQSIGCFCFGAPVNAGDIQLLLDDAAKLGIQHSKCVSLSIFLQELFETWIVKTPSELCFA